MDVLEYLDPVAADLIAADRCNCIFDIQNIACEYRICPGAHDSLGFDQPILLLALSFLLEFGCLL